MRHQATPQEAARGGPDGCRPLAILRFVRPRSGAVRLSGVVLVLALAFGGSPGFPAGVHRDHFERSALAAPQNVHGETMVAMDTGVVVRAEDDALRSYVVPAEGPMESRAELTVGARVLDLDARGRRVLVAIEGGRIMLLDVSEDGRLLSLVSEIEAETVSRVAIGEELYAYAWYPGIGFLTLGDDGELAHAGASGLDFCTPDDASLDAGLLALACRGGELYVAGLEEQGDVWYRQQDRHMNPARLHFRDGQLIASGHLERQDLAPLDGELPHSGALAVFRIQPQPRSLLVLQGMTTLPPVGESDAYEPQSLGLLDDRVFVGRGGGSTRLNELAVLRIDTDGAPWETEQILLGSEDSPDSMAVAGDTLVIASEDAFPMLHHADLPGDLVLEARTGIECGAPFVADNWWGAASPIAVDGDRFLVASLGCPTIRMGQLRADGRAELAEEALDLASGDVLALHLDGALVAAVDGGGDAEATLRTGQWRVGAAPAWRHHAALTDLGLKGEIKSVAFDGQRLALGVGDALAVLLVSAEEAPIVLATTELNVGYGDSLAWQGDHLYAADEAEGGIRVFAVGERGELLAPAGPGFQSQIRWGALAVGHGMLFATIPYRWDGAGPHRTLSQVLAWFALDEEGGLRLEGSIGLPQWRHIEVGPIMEDLEAWRAPVVVDDGLFLRLDSMGLAYWARLAWNDGDPTWLGGLVHDTAWDGSDDAIRMGTDRLLLFGAYDRDVPTRSLASYRIRAAGSGSTLEPGPWSGVQGETRIFLPSGFVGAR